MGEELNNTDNISANTNDSPNISVQATDSEVSELNSEIPSIASDGEGNTPELIILQRAFDWIKQNLFIALLIPLMLFLAGKYISVRLPANNLRFSDTHIEDVYYYTNEKGETTPCYPDWTNLSFVIENIDNHDAIIQDVSIEVVSFEEYVFQTDVFSFGVGDGGEYMYYIASLENGTSSDAYMYDTFVEEYAYGKDECSIEKCLQYAKKYDASHYEKLSENETDYVILYLVNFPENGYYTLDIQITYLIGNDTREKTIHVDSFLAITNKTFQKYYKSY